MTGAFDPERVVTPLPVHIPMPSDSEVGLCHTAACHLPPNKRHLIPPPPLLRTSLVQISRAAALLSGAKRPVFVLGSQCTLPPVPAEEVRQALEGMGVPCFLGGMSRGWIPPSPAMDFPPSIPTLPRPFLPPPPPLFFFPGLLGRDNPIHIRQKRGEALKEADVVVLAGAVCDFRLGYGRTLSRKSRIIAVNRNKLASTCSFLFSCEAHQPNLSPLPFPFPLSQSAGRAC